MRSQSARHTRLYGVFEKSNCTSDALPSKEKERKKNKRKQEKRKVAKEKRTKKTRNKESKRK